MEKFRELRTLHGTSTHFRENVKDWFQIEHELCNWIINLWYYSKYMNDDEILEMYAFVNLELIKNYWDKENYIDCEFLIGHLLANDSSFFNFEVFIQPKNFSFSKYNIYNIITKPDKVPSSFQKKNELFNEDSTSFNCFKLLSVSSFFSFKKKKMVGSIHPFGQYINDMPYYSVEELVWIVWDRHRGGEAWGRSVGQAPTKRSLLCL